MAAIIPILGGLVSSAGNLFGSIQQRKTQELINEGRYIDFVSEKELQRQQQETYLIIGGIVIIVILAILIYRSK